MDAIRKIEAANIRQFVGELILADRVMQRQGLVWGDRYEELSQPIRAARKALDDALDANEQTLASKEAELVRLRDELTAQISSFDGDAIDEIEAEYGLGTAQRIDRGRRALTTTPQPTE